jgi:hypothetical protein
MPEPLGPQNRSLEVDGARRAYRNATTLPFEA